MFNTHQIKAGKDKADRVLIRVWVLRRRLHINWIHKNKIHFKYQSFSYVCVLGPISHGSKYTD